MAIPPPGNGGRTPTTGADMDTRTIAIIALIIAVVVLILVL
jgi:hypothetical protein